VPQGNLACICPFTRVHFLATQTHHVVFRCGAAAALNVKTVQQLGSWKLYRAAKAMAALAATEVRLGHSPPLPAFICQSCLQHTVLYAMNHVAAVLQVATAGHCTPLLAAVLHSLGLWSPCHMACCLQEAACRPAGAASNINGLLDKQWEAASLGEVLVAPPSALQGLGPK
jgi:hypothetical protein